MENKNFNQYDEAENGRFYFNKVVDAKYTDQKEHDYIGNALIEALPPIYDTEQLVHLLTSDVHFSPEERLLEKEYRIQAVFRLMDFMCVLSRHILTAQTVDVVIKRGYVPRRIPTCGTLREMKIRAEEFGEYFDKITGEAKRIITVSTAPPMSGFLIYGTSGAGKTSAINKILSLYPHGIRHTEYHGDQIVFKQLPYVKFDCTYDGSVKGICLNFFEAVDEILGTNYLEKKAKSNVSKLIASMHYTVNLHGIGCIVIDEIQHLHKSKIGIEKVMNYLVTLQNTLKVPIIMIGTYKAVGKVLNQDFRQRRRVSGVGEIEWGLIKNNKEFKHIMKSIWKYQWIQNPSKLTKTIIDAFYQNSMGNMDRLMKLFMLCQIEAIRKGTEIIDASLVDEMAERQPLTNKIIKALREEDYETLSKFDDVVPIDFQTMMLNPANSRDYDIQFEEMKRMLAEKQDIGKKTIHNELIVFAEDMGITRKLALKIVDKVLIGNNSDKKISELKRIIAQEVVQPVNKTKETRKIKSKVPEVDELKIVYVDDDED